MSTAPSFRLASISHLMLGVSNLPTALSFYRDRLGLELAFDSPGFAFLNAGGVTLALSEELAKLPGSTVGATEIVFGVESVETAHGQLSAAGVAFTQDPRQVTPDQWAANFQDPDGHRLSIFGPR